MLPLVSQIEYFERIAYFLKRGYALVQALELILAQPLRPAYVALTSQWLHAAKTGKTDFPAFDKVNGTLKLFIHSGLQAQALAKFLDQGLNLIKARQEFRNQLLQAGLYPLLVLAACGLLFGFIAGWVLPQLVLFFQDAGLNLPPVLSGYLWFKKYLLPLTLVFLLMAGGLWFFYRKSVKSLIKKYQKSLGQFLTRFEVWNEFLILPWLLGFRALIELGWAELPALQTSLTLAPHFENLVEFPLLIRDLQTGQSLSRAFQNQAKAPVFLKAQLMLAAQGQDLAASLRHLEDYYRAKNERFLKIATALVEPALIAGMGILVGGLVVFVFFPLLQSMQAISF